VETKEKKRKKKLLFERKKKKKIPTWRPRERERERETLLNFNIYSLLVNVFTSIPFIATRFSMTHLSSCDPIRSSALPTSPYSSSSFFSSSSSSRSTTTTTTPPPPYPPALQTHRVLVVR
jgi:hypothetical protein